MTARVARKHPHATPSGALFDQLSWFVRLRWVAAASVMVAAIVDRTSFGWYPRAGDMLVLGVLIFAYNVVLFLAMHAVAGKPWDRHARRRFLLFLAWSQILLDMVCLTLLVLWTGGVHSPLAGFFVFHMVFASLLLPRIMAYAVALAAMVMMAAALTLTDRWPADRTSRLAIAGACVTLVMTVHLANRLTRGLRHQRHRLVEQNRRIRAISRQLRRQQQAMVQHEKMVALGQMAAGVTHEINNPLASIDSVLQLALRRPERMTPDTLRTLREQVERIRQIIQQMRTFAHPDESQRQTLELNEVVAAAVNMVRFDTRVRQVHVDQHYAPDVGRVSLLPQALHQVIVNLIMNALDAMEDVPEPRLTLRTERREGWYLIDVTDNGHGVRPEHMGRLFEPFFTTKPVGKGTGLGLSISYSLVQRQGGSISVKSHPGKGTTFTIRLPATETPSRPREAAGKGIAVSENPTA